MTTFDLEVLMQGTIQQLQLEARYFSELTAHNAEKGRLNESHLVRTMRRYLPDKFGIGTGFVVSGGSKIEQSRQCDIIIFDRVNNVPFYSSEAWQIYPIEMVYGVVEVKTTLNKAEIKDAFEKCVHLRKMSDGHTGPNKAYVRQDVIIPGSPAIYAKYKSGLPPRFFIFGYSGPERSTLEKNLHELTLEIQDAHIHGLCQLENNASVFAAHIAYKPSEGRLRMLEGNGMLNFLLEMPKVLNSMHGVAALVRAEPSGSGPDIFPYRPEHFDVVDLDHYKSFKLQSLES
jgi:hypothetical protein